MRRLSSVFAPLVLTTSLACGSASPTSPTAPPSRLLVSGQSNAVLLLPALAAMTPTDGYAIGSTAIVNWSPSGFAWAALLPSLHAPANAFVWFQGEADGAAGPGLNDQDGGFGPKDPDAFTRYSDEAYTAYTVAFRDLIARVRQTTGDSSLRIIDVELGPYYRYAPVKRAQQDVLAADGNARYVRTSDLAWQEGGGHLNLDQYAIVAQRVIAAAR